MLQNITVGKLGEKAAVNYLLDKGYSILETHYTSHWGELDIIAFHAEKLIFVEVKTRVGEAMGKPYEAVGRTKISHLMRTIQQYLLKNKLSRYKLSLDVISIVLDREHNILSLKHFENIYSG